MADANGSFQLFCLDFDDAGDRTYPPPDPPPSLRSDARDNPPDRSTWSARKPGGYEAGERVDDEVRVGRRVWVRHGHVNVTRLRRPGWERGGRIRWGEEIRRDGTSGVECTRKKAERQTSMGDGVYYHIMFVKSHL